MAASPSDAFGLALDVDALVSAQGRLLLGGHPARLFRLSAAGARTVASWAAGGAVGDEVAARALAARLIDAAVMHPIPAPADAQGRVTIVVPTNRAGGELDRCLGALGASHAPLVVVNDGSVDPVAIQRVSAAHGARLVVLGKNRGPAAARNAGLAVATTPLVAFVDSDVVATADWLELLVPHFDDPSVHIVAPRVLPLAQGGGMVGDYEAHHSKLDMGASPASPRPGRPVPYVPSAAMVVRRDRFEGFDESLRTGEDVDLCWRSVAAGGRIVYDPRAIVRHDHRVRLRAFVARRWAYAMSIGALARRHPNALPATRIPVRGALLVGAAVAGRPAIAVMLLVDQWRRTQQTVRDPSLSARLTARHVRSTARGAAWALRRPWLVPLLFVAGRSSRVRTALAVALLVDVVDRPLKPRHVPLAVVEDVVAAVATWVACGRAGTLRPVLPAWGAGDVSDRRASPV